MSFALSNTTFGKDGAVVFLTARKARSTLNGLRPYDNNHVIGVIDYPRLALFPSFRASVVVICDVERMPPAYEERVFKIVAQWKEMPEAPLVLNQPPTALRRFELLRRLYKAGVNKKDVHRLDDPDTVEKTRFPCFIRDEIGHHLFTPAPRLLHTSDELLEEMRTMLQNGVSLFGKIVVEFEDTRDDTGYYCKSGYFRIADAYIPTHRFWSKEWFVKHSDRRLIAQHPELIEREKEFVQSNSHGAELARVFELAGVEYGRIDYGVRQDGGIHVFEINTSPNHPRLQAIAEERKDILGIARRNLISALEDLAATNPCVCLRWPRDEIIYRLQNQI